MKATRTLVLALNALLSFACSNDDADEPDTAPGEFASCSKGALEPDITTTLELAGPGVDPSSGVLTPGEYHISATYLALKSGKEALANQLAGPVIEELFGMAGLVAVATSRSSSCASLRTLTVWESEEAMFAFVASPAHVRAMAQTLELSRGTSNTIAWKGNAGSATWQEAARQLKAEAGGEI